MAALRFVPLIILTIALAITSFLRKKGKLPWLIVTFILWLIAFLYAIRVFD